MSVSESTEERVNLGYRGSALGTFWWYLVAAVLGVFIIPAAWGAAILYRWLIRRVSFSDGTRAAFEGRADQVWGWFALAAGYAHIPTVFAGALTSGDPFAMNFNPEALGNFLESGDPSAITVYYILQVGYIPIGIYVLLVIYRWIVAGIRLSDGPDLHFIFIGRYLPLLGWLLLYAVSYITIIGWAWVGTAFLRWFASKVEGDGVRFKFVGRGWGLLWRVFVASLLTIVIIPIPWVWTWVLRWLVRNTLMIKATASPSMATAPEV